MSTAISDVQTNTSCTISTDKHLGYTCMAPSEGIEDASSMYTMYCERMPGTPCNCCTLWCQTLCILYTLSALAPSYWPPAVAQPVLLMLQSDVKRGNSVGTLVAYPIQ